MNRLSLALIFSGGAIAAGIVYFLWASAAGGWTVRAGSPVQVVPQLDSGPTTEGQAASVLTIEVASYRPPEQGMVAFEIRLERGANSLTLGRISFFPDVPFSSRSGQNDGRTFAFRAGKLTADDARAARVIIALVPSGGDGRGAELRIKELRLKP